jgi:hypothetical protein
MFGLARKTGLGEDIIDANKPTPGLPNAFGVWSCACGPDCGDRLPAALRSPRSIAFGAVVEGNDW